MIFPCPNCRYENNVAGIWFHSEKKAGELTADGTVPHKIIECIECGYTYSLERELDGRPKGSTDQSARRSEPEAQL